jgi:hypothetical protein
MNRSLLAYAVLLAAVGCKSDGEGGESTNVEETGSGSARTGSSGGFSASLSAELAKDGRPSERTAGSDDGSAMAGSGSAPGNAMAGSAMAGSGSAMKSGSGAGSGSAAMAGSGSATKSGSGAGSGSSAGSGSAAMAGSGSAMKAGSGAGSAVAMGSGAGSAMKAGSGAGSAVAMGSGAGSGAMKAGSGAGSAVAMGSGAGSGAKAGSGSAPAKVDPPRVAVKVPGDLAAIKLSLLPNWERDLDEAGTISLFVKIQARNESAVFKFSYGYDPANAPADREDYKKFLAETKLLKVTADRQRGAAWYLEGTDGTGKPAFRVLVNYGGKRLVCFGSLYKDSSFGDFRDEVVIQAKKICETLTL